MLRFSTEPQQVPFMSQTFTIPVSGSVKVLSKLKFRDIIAILNKDCNSNQVDRSMEYWKAKLNSENCVIYLDGVKRNACP